MNGEAAGSTHWGRFVYWKKCDGAVIRQAIHESSLDDEWSNGQESVSKHALVIFSEASHFQWFRLPLLLLLLLLLGVAVRQATRWKLVRVQWEYRAVQRGMDGSCSVLRSVDGRSARTKTNEQVLFDAKPACYRALQNEAICSLIRTEQSQDDGGLGWEIMGDWQDCWEILSPLQW
jgi:hypothetical protein